MRDLGVSIFLNERRHMHDRRPPGNVQIFSLSEDTVEQARAADKADFGNTLLHFLDVDGSHQLFPKKSYNRLSMTFGHIAHYVESVMMWSPGVIRRVDTAFKRPSTLHNCIVHGSTLQRAFG